MTPAAQHGPYVAEKKEEKGGYKRKSQTDSNVAKLLYQHD